LRRCVGDLNGSRGKSRELDPYWFMRDDVEEFIQVIERLGFDYEIDDLLKDKPVLRIWTKKENDQSESSTIEEEFEAFQTIRKVKVAPEITVLFNALGYTRLVKKLKELFGDGYEG